MIEWTHPFLEQRPYIRPSLNQARIVDLPGINLPWELRKNGYQLLGSHALHQRILAHFPQLTQSPDLFLTFDHLLAEGDERALALGREYGRSLGALLLMLKRGDAINRVIRPDWQATHWEFWHNISTVWLGGGLMAGQLGEITAAAAQDLLHRHRFSGASVRRSPFAAHLPLVGVARTAPENAPAMLVFDFGQTSVKRAVAVYENSALTALHLLPSLPADCTSINLRNDRRLAEKTAVFLTQAIAQSWQEAQMAGWPVSFHMAAAIACYLVGGHPALLWDMGCYGRLQLLTADLPRYLAERVSEMAGTPLELRLFHDGTAAALTYAGDGKARSVAETAVLTLGTAIGNGFPPTSKGLRPIDANFQLVK